MTVQELIKHLQSFPQDAECVCVYMNCSEYSVLDVEDVTYHGNGVIKGPYGIEKRYIRRNSIIMEYDPKQWDQAKDGEPTFIPIVTFPGI